MEGYTPIWQQWLPLMKEERQQGVFAGVGSGVAVLEDSSFICIFFKSIWSWMTS